MGEHPVNAVARWPMCGPPVDVVLPVLPVTQPGLGAAPRMKHAVGEGRRKRRRRAAGTPSASWDAVGAAIGLLTARHLGIGTGQAEIIGEIPPESVISALEILANAFLHTLLPDEEAATSLLQDFGLMALTEGVRRLR